MNTEDVLNEVEKLNKTNKKALELKNKIKILNKMINYIRIPFALSFFGIPISLIVGILVDGYVFKITLSCLVAFVFLLIFTRSSNELVEVYKVDLKECENKVKMIK